MYSNECLDQQSVHGRHLRGKATYEAHRVVQRKAADCEDLADGDDDVAEQEQLHFPVQVRTRHFALRAGRAPSSDGGLLPFGSPEQEEGGEDCDTAEDYRACDSQSSVNCASSASH